LPMARRSVHSRIVASTPELPPNLGRADRLNETGGRPMSAASTGYPRRPSTNASPSLVAWRFPMLAS